jgi:hypothetical protein
LWQTPGGNCLDRGFSHWTDRQVHSLGSAFLLSCIKGQTLGVQTETIDGLISPRPGFEIDFLELLDRRRYNLTLIDDENEFYVATSRRGVSLPTPKAP